MDFSALSCSPEIPFHTARVRTPLPPLGAVAVEVTVTVALADLAPSVVFTVIVAVPAATPVTTPLAASTLAIAALLEVQLTA